MAFDFDGKRYKEASKHQKEWGNKIIQEMNIKEDSFILDLGCGDGVLTQILSSKVPKGKVIGIDASKGMIDTAIEIREENLEFRFMDINNINFEEKFDLIFSNAALHWVKNHKKLFYKCNNVLKDGGRIRFNFGGHGNCQNFFEVVKEITKYEEYNNYFKDFEWPWYMPSTHEYKELANEAKVFKNINIYEENVDRYFQNEEQIIGWIDQPTIVPFISILPENIKQEFRDKVVEKMLERTKQEDGTYFETFRRINILAEKA
nr:methyltransferase domain-containing protein [Clostridium chromiireducens]